MSEPWAVSMLISGGVFVGAVLSIAWERVPAWRRSDLLEFRAAFGHTLRRVDIVQPALLIVWLISTLGFAITAGAPARTPALAAAAGLFIVLVGSVAWLVPLQRRLLSVAPYSTPTRLESMRMQWLRGHVVRASLAVASLILVIVAAVL